MLSGADEEDIFFLFLVTDCDLNTFTYSQKFCFMKLNYCDIKCESFIQTMSYLCLLDIMFFAILSLFFMAGLFSSYFRVLLNIGFSL